MKDYTYNEEELEFAKHIHSIPPKKIWWDFMTCIFDYGDFYFQVQCVSEIADTQNKSDEAITGKFTKHHNPFVPEKYNMLLCENKRIDELYIVRVFLYFTNSETYSKTKIIFNKARTKAKELLTGKSDTFGNLVSGASSGHKEITCHPKSEQAKKVDEKYSNLIDAGLLLQIDGKWLKAFVERNGFGFHIWNEKYFFELDEINEIASQYELIKI